MLVTVAIPPTIGRVCYLDAAGHRPTVECYTNKIAYRFELVDGTFVAIGDWVRVSGQVRVGKTRSRKTGLIDGIRKYYHSPFDGSDQANWKFLELTNPICTVMGPIYLSTALLEVIDRSKAHIENWSRNKQKGNLLSTIGSLQKALDALYEALREITRDEIDKNAKPAKLPEIDYADL